MSPGRACSTATWIIQLSPGATSHVSAFPATLTGPAGNGTGYAASLSLPKAGAYALDTIVTDGGVIAGRSELRSMTALLPYVVTTPRVKRPVVPVGVALYPFPVRRPAGSFHASFRQSLTVLPLRFTSFPVAWY